MVTWFSLGKAAWSAYTFQDVVGNLVNVLPVLFPCKSSFLDRVAQRDSVHTLKFYLSDSGKMKGGIRMLMTWEDSRFTWTLLMPPGTTLLIFFFLVQPFEMISIFFSVVGRTAWCLFFIYVVKCYCFISWPVCENIFDTAVFALIAPQWIPGKSC